MPRFHLAADAEQDLLDIWLYIARSSSVDRAEGMNQGFFARFQLLASNPLIGRARPELAPGLRSFPAGSYLIFYRPITDGIEVVRVLHGSRDFEGLFEPGPGQE